MRLGRREEGGRGEGRGRSLKEGIRSMFKTVKKVVCVCVNDVCRGV